MGTKFGTSLVAAFHLIISFNGFVLFLILGLFLALGVGIPFPGYPGSYYYFHSYNFRDELASFSAHVRKNPGDFDIITKWLVEPVIGTYVVELVIWTAMVIFFLRILINSALLKGVVSGKPGWIKFWLWVHVVEEIFLNTPIKVLVCIYVADNIHPAIKIVPMVLSYFVEGLCLWIVYATMRDLSPSTTKVSSIEIEQPFAISDGQNTMGTRPMVNLAQQLRQEIQLQNQQQQQANTIHFQQQQPFFQHQPHPAGFHQPIIFQQPVQLHNQGQQQQQKQQQQQPTKVVTDSDYVDEKKMEFIIKKLLVKTASENEAP